MLLVDSATFGVRPRPLRMASFFTAAKSSSARFTELTRMPANWPDLREAMAWRLIFLAVLLKKPRSCWGGCNGAVILLSSFDHI